jgi:hypothetical protein
MVHGREFDRPGTYRIRAKGNLDAEWSDWFDGFAIEATGENETVLTGVVVDQAALYGLLSKLRDLGLPLLLVERVRAGLDGRGEQPAAHLS